MAQDLVIVALAIVTVLYILKKEERPAQILLELICFVFLYAAVYENFATLMKWYGYGRSALMVFNVPLTVPLVEFLVVYLALRVLATMEIPTWCKPFVVGVTGMLFDFTLDPIATMQVFSTREGVSGRWSWFIGPNDVHIFTDPVYNYSGWVLLCGYAAALLLLGRWWYKRSGYNQVVGYVYPIVAMLAALGLIVSPLSSFLLWLQPLFSKGSWSEWVMLCVHAAAAITLLAVFWRGRMKSALSMRGDLPVFLVLAGLPLSEVVFTIAGGYFSILWIEVVFTVILGAALFLVYLRGRESARARARAKATHTRSRSVSRKTHARRG
jgi:hypothetical protein